MKEIEFTLINSRKLIVKVDNWEHHHGLPLSAHSFSKWISILLNYYLRS